MSNHRNNEGTGGNSLKGKITVGPRDGIGPEIIDEGVKVFQAVAGKYSHDFELTYKE
jgi:isocitrate/isopropylmalate dehydrogenase|tara:strand:- start:178 stop:348 length:171 start_codon:yes stop_codon:yes gene_type:complete